MERNLTFTEHLEELRTRVIVSLVALGLASLACMPLAPRILKILKEPAGSAIGKLAYFSPQDAFLIYMRIGFLCGIIIAFPIIAYQFWRFVSPAVDDKFKRYVTHFVIFSSAAFAGGCVFAYFVLLPKALHFLMSFGTDDLEPVISAGRYISFVTMLIAACGLIFEMPVLSFILTKIGLVNHRLLRRNFKYAVVILAIVAAAITPTVDAFNMLVIMVPMIALYEVSIWVSFIVRR